MLAGTEREVLELLVERPRSPTEVAEEMGVSVQTASRNLKKLVEREFARETREGEGRGYKRYRAKEFAQLFAGFDGELYDRRIDLSPSHRAVLSTLSVPQSQFHGVLLSYLFSPHADKVDAGVVGIAVYGSVARGDADPDSDIDLLVIRNPAKADDRYPDIEDMNEFLHTTFAGHGGLVDHEHSHVVSEQWFTVSEFRDGLDAGSQFLRNVLDESIVLYDPEGVIRGARQERAGERVPP